ncbi:MAG: hypothetical protein VR70_10695 [Rhodospirillaceae bacterium BRH_c57]|nr:MAG: hypothetical protein VR70_10695 [Rhodospirillaceae bacterium BRH_c57]
MSKKSVVEEVMKGFHGIFGNERKCDEEALMREWEAMAKAEPWRRLREDPPSPSFPFPDTWHSGEATPFQGIEGGELEVEYIIGDIQGSRAMDGGFREVIASTEPLPVSGVWPDVGFEDGQYAVYFDTEKAWAWIRIDGRLCTLFELSDTAVRQTVSTLKGSRAGEEAEFILYWLREGNVATI